MKTFKFFQKEKGVDELRREVRLMALNGNIPQDVIDCGEIGAYEQGIEAGITSTGFNPYHDQLRGEIWNRGFWVATNLIHRR
jgi:hypothetical protein